MPDRSAVSADRREGHLVTGGGAERFPEVIWGNDEVHVRERKDPRWSNFRATI